MNILFTLDENYVPPLKVLIYSLMYHHPEGVFDFYVMHEDITEQSLNQLQDLVDLGGHRLHVYDCTEWINQITGAYVNRHYSLEMYLWLFAPYVLPEEVDRILYIDPDVINMNDLSDLYEIDLEGHLFAGGSYDFKNAWIQPINNLRLGTLDSTHYYNTGIIVMDLAQLRLDSSPAEIIAVIRKKEKVLYLPDQDVFNYLYEDLTKRVDWALYNLDPRPYEVLTKLNSTEYNDDFVENEVVFIHYCGKHKPWNEREEYRYSLGKYWFYYEEKFLDNTITLEERP